MNALHDPLLSREAIMGFYSFLYSEKMRHAGDIAKIGKMLNKIEGEQKMTLKEIQELRRNAMRYVEF